MITIEQFKRPKVKPNLDHKTFIVVVRAHMDKRHKTCKNYWAGICPVCWTQTTN